MTIEDEIAAQADITESTESTEQTRAAVEAARRLAGQVTPPRGNIDAHLARALRNLAVDEDSLEGRLALVDEIRQLSARHGGAIHEIYMHLGAAIVCLSRSVGRSTSEHVDLVNELGVLRERWPASVVIAAVYVAEVWNAYVMDGLEARPEQLIAEVEVIRSGLPESHQDIERALEYLRAELAGEGVEEPERD
jgi:hypothetical protein